METNNSFKDCVVIACGTLSPELNYLKNEGFLDAKKILYTTPGLHEIPRELESQLIDRITKARELSNKIIVVYGGQFCYVNSNDLFRTIDTIISEQGEGIVRIQASHCVDMIAGKEEREKIANGEKVWWMTPGWILFRHDVFKDWQMKIFQSTQGVHYSSMQLIFLIPMLKNMRIMLKNMRIRFLNTLTG